MERFFNFLERVRGYPEPVRRQFFWLSVSGLVFVIGALWLVTFPWQLQNTQEDIAVGDAQTQPTLSETLGQGGAAVGDMARGALRDWLLGDAPQENAVQEPEEEAALAPQEALPRLPRAE